MLIPNGELLMFLLVTLSLMGFKAGELLDHKQLKASSSSKNSPSPFQEICCKNMSDTHDGTSSRPLLSLRS